MEHTHENEVDEPFGTFTWEDAVIGAVAVVIVMLCVASAALTMAMY